MHHTREHTSRQYRACVEEILHEQATSVNHHPLCYCITCTRSSLSCLLTFYGIPIFHTFLIGRTFLFTFTITVCSFKIQVIITEWKSVILMSNQHHYRVQVERAQICSLTIVYVSYLYLASLLTIPTFFSSHDCL